MVGCGRSWEGLLATWYGTLGCTPERSGGIAALVTRAIETAPLETVEERRVGPQKHLYFHCPPKTALRRALSRYLHPNLCDLFGGPQTITTFRFGLETTQSDRRLGLFDPNSYKFQFELGSGNRIRVGTDGGLVGSDVVW